MNERVHRILFICHGNICRSTMAQFVMEDLVKKAGASDNVDNSGNLGPSHAGASGADSFVIDSAATSTEELGNQPHPGTLRKLREVGVPVHAHRARQVKRVEYDDWDLFVYMDGENEWNLQRIFGGDPEGKCRRLLDFAPVTYKRHGQDVADPWYTGNFDATYDDVLAGCRGLLEELRG